MPLRQQDGDHVLARNTLTGALVYQFDYDGQGRLMTVTDGDDEMSGVGPASDRKNGHRNGVGQRSYRLKAVAGNSKRFGCPGNDINPKCW